MSENGQYPAVFEDFQKRFPNYRLNGANTLRGSLSTSASRWNNVHLEALRVLYIPNSKEVAHEGFKPRAFSPKLQDDLRAFEDVSFRRPRHELVKHSRLYGFYDCLATVLERPTVLFGSLETVKDRTGRTSADLHPGYVSGEGLGLSSPFPSQEEGHRTHRGRTPDTDSYHGSQTSTDSSAVQDRSKDERATASMANAFLSGILSLIRADEIPGGSSPQDSSLLEFTPVSARFVVRTANFEYVAEDDGGLVLRDWDNLHKWSQKGPRYCSIECKGRLLGEGLDMGIHVEDVLAQHVGEMIAQAHGLLLQAGIDFDSEDWDEDKVAGIDCTGVLLCFSQSIFTVKTATFSPSYLRKLFHRAPKENSIMFSDSSSPELPMEQDDSEDGSWDGSMTEAKGKANEGRWVEGGYEEQEDKEDTEDEEEKEQGEEEEDEDEDEDEEFLQIHCGKPYDLASSNGRAQACYEVLGVVEYLRQRVMRM